ncbi:aspartate aminotransferase family protein [Acidocella aminolytica]|jgi:4-aminobutyrate aminotransferase-like enzyme|uniref:Aminotransferase n=1 Tax=Acidocella aminolytica 101 = DSM 11237 TaxID=1120923 RepID=A0A0D6PKV1_9PROT|nr:aspartate aminotransferase family protein [Acidocella aminolytica]GAN81828.1 aminotransferase [Acidocella aminolytica 101 = DSM 11237]GBQ39149.1 4-aminobutyrate aminotransferase [Acidocella aminolytica 101 = DSM 11237]SHF57783.1 4-aminobutyrate aminotransferase [Acidocella aminolytica 101 = DSM 11237]
MSETLLARRRESLSPSYRLFYDEPLRPVRGKGVWLYEEDGTACLDAYNNVVPAGHCHPRIVAAVAAQTAQLNTHTRYLHQTILDYAEALLATFPAALNRATFTCTGSEANDLAIRVARHVTGGTGIIVTENAYHGVTLATAEISPSLGAKMPLGAHVRTVPAPAEGMDFSAAVRAAIKDLQRHGIKPALLVVDTIFSSDGVFADPPGFLATAAEAIHEAGGLFLADEVQPGFGRTGSAMWGFARHELMPDMVSLGKPMGNGYPAAGLVAQSHVIDAFGQNIRYFNTFGGNPVAMAAALETLRVIQEEKLMENAATTGAYLMAGLKARHQVQAVRGDGLFIGAELADGALASRVVNHMRAHGVLISASGPAGNVLKIRPPLVFTPAHADILFSALDGALADG